MMPTAEHLAVDHPVLVTDLPGFGQSGDPRQVLTLPALVDALVQWLDQQQLARPIFLGNSLGCQVLIDLVVRGSRDPIAHPTLGGGGGAAVAQRTLGGDSRRASCGSTTARRTALVEVVRAFVDETSCRV
jgi:pimeloyl-ACP methyl ester carboxylesterase